MKTFGIQYDATYAVVIAEDEQDAINIINERGFEQLHPYAFDKDQPYAWVCKWTDNPLDISPVSISIIDSIKRGVVSFEQH